MVEEYCAKCKKPFESKDGIWVKIDIMTFHVCSEECKKKFPNYYKRLTAKVSKSQVKVENMEQKFDLGKTVMSIIRMAKVVNDLINAKKGDIIEVSIEDQGISKFKRIA